MGRRVRNLSASEAIYAFAGWLSSRQQPITISSRHDAAELAVLVEEYCLGQKLDEPRRGYENAILPMPTEVGNDDTE